MSSVVVVFNLIVCQTISLLNTVRLVLLNLPQKPFPLGLGPFPFGLRAFVVQIKSLGPLGYMVREKCFSYVELNVTSQLLGYVGRGYRCEDIEQP